MKKSSLTELKTHKERTMSRGSRDGFSPQVNDINRPLTSNRIVNVSHKFPNLKDVETSMGISLRRYITLPMEV